jgi:hypothetical protein
MSNLICRTIRDAKKSVANATSFRKRGHRKEAAKKQVGVSIDRHTQKKWFHPRDVMYSSMSEYAMWCVHPNRGVTYCGYSRDPTTRSDMSRPWKAPLRMFENGSLCCMWTTSPPDRMTSAMNGRLPKDINTLV